MRIVLIDSTEHQHSDVEQMIEYLKHYYRSHQLELETVKLKNLRITKCSQCRGCTQKIGDMPEKCFIDDEMNYIIDEIESADAYIILSDTKSVFNKNKIHQKFSTRLVAYYYWPFGQLQSIPRKVNLHKKSILINYNTASYFKAQSFKTSTQELGQTATAIGAEVVDSLMIKPAVNFQAMMNNYTKQLEALCYKLIPKRQMA